MPGVAAPSVRSSGVMRRTPPLIEAPPLVLGPRLLFPCGDPDHSPARDERAGEVYDPPTGRPMEHYQTPEDEFRALMSGDHPRLRRNRALLARLPTDPRCKTCNAPFGFPGSLVSRAMGRPRFPKNPRFCQFCFNWLTATGIRGADIELTVLFSDVRDSVGLAERLGPAVYTALIDRYYHVASNAVIMANGIADRFVGDAVL